MTEKIFPVPFYLPLPMIFHHKRAIVFQLELRMNDFEKRFRQFISSRSECKILDDGKSNVNGEIADFLLDAKRIIAELKCLDEDMIEKLQTLATEIIDGRNLEFYGEFPFSDLIDSQPDKNELKKQAVLKIAGPLERHFKKANSQIKNIKRQLNLEDSHGLLILANTHNASLEPQAALWFLSVLLHRRKQDGSPICSSIDCILYLTQVHRVGELDGVKLQPAVTMLREEHYKYDGLDKYLQELLEDWAKFNNVPIFFSEKPFHEITDFSKIPMRRGGLLKDLTKRPKGWYIAVSFSMPALCGNCGARFAHPAADRNPMYVNEPQKDLLAVGFVCPRCDGIAATYAADLVVDRKQDIVTVYPWTGTVDDFLRTDWRSFIDRRNPPPNFVIP